MAEVIIDLDQTLYNFDAEVREAFFELAIERNDKSLLRGAYSSSQDWRELEDSTGLDVALEAIKIVHDRTLEQIPFKGSVNTCCMISDSGHKIKYVTSRKESYYQDTLDWLKENNFPGGEVICSTHDKREHFGDAQFLIDDRPKTILNFIYDYEWQWKQETYLQTEKEYNEATRLAFGLWTPYNKNLTDVKNVLLAPTWRGIQFYLERKGIIA